MILSFQNDGGLVVYPSLEDVMRAIEPQDALETLLNTFDDGAQRYVVELFTPGPSSLGVFGTSVTASVNGEYRLVPSGPPEPSALLNAIHSAQYVAPGSAVALVEALTARLKIGR